MLYWMVPDYPAKNKHLKYHDILASMLKVRSPDPSLRWLAESTVARTKYAVTEPVLVQGCLIAFAASAIFSCFWTSSTLCAGFLLTRLWRSR